MRRNLALVAVWIFGCAVAIALAVFAVNLAGAKVTDRPVATVSRGQLEAETASAAPSTTATGAGVDPAAGPGPTEGDPGAAGSPDGGSPTTAAPTPSPTTAGASGSPSGPGTPGASAPSTTVAASSPTTASDGGGTPRGGEGGPASTTTTTAPAAVVDQQTYVLVGGVVTVRCEGASVSGTYSPSSGFTYDLRSPGPATFEVRFQSDQHQSEVKASCVNGLVSATPKESGKG